MNLKKKKILRGQFSMRKWWHRNGHFKSELVRNNYMSCQIPIFVIFFFFNVKFILSIKKCKKVIFENTILKKVAKKGRLAP